MIKILFFIPGLSEGGAEKVLRSLVNNMDHTKFDITVQTIDEYDPKKYLAEDIHYKAVNRCKTALGKKFFSYWFRLCAELKLAWVHCDLSKKEGMAESAEKIKKQYRQFDKIVCVSEDTRAGFYKLFGNDFDTVVLHNVIDEEEMCLTQQKNFAYLLDTCGRLHNDGCWFRLNVMGEGPERENLENQNKDLHLEDIVELRGFIRNPYPWIKAADIIVCSSKYEGISTVIQEAYFLGKSIVTTLCTGMTELLGSSEYGLLVNALENGLYEGIKEMINHPQKVQYYAMPAKKRSETFVKEKIIAETEGLFLKEFLSTGC